MAECRDCGIEIEYDEIVEAWFRSDGKADGPNGVGAEHKPKTWLAYAEEEANFYADADARRLLTANESTWKKRGQSA